MPISKQVYTGEYTVNHEGRQVPNTGGAVTTSVPKVTITTTIPTTKK